MAKKVRGKKKIIPENFSDSYSNGSMVIRVEDLLSGRSYRELSDIATCLYDKYNSIFQERLDVYLEAYSALPPEEEDMEYLDFLKRREILYIPPENLTEAQRYEIYTMYMNEIYSYENHMSRLTIIPDTDPRADEGYVYEDIKNSPSIINSLQLKLMSYMTLPTRLFLEDRISLFASQIEINNECRDYKICLAVNRDYLFENYGNVLKKLQKLKKTTGKTIELVIDFDGNTVEPNTYDRRVPYSYTSDEYEKLVALKESGLADRLYFSEFKTEEFMPFRRERLWSDEEVLFANRNKHALISELKPLRLSPFEKVLAIHRHVAGHFYAGVATSSEKTRTFLTATAATSEESAEELFLQGKGFVCTSFSSYAKALIDEFGDKNVQCKFINLEFYDKTTRRKKVSATHQVLLVHIVDEKYGLNGYYIWDPTWDYENEGFSHCLFPVGDLENYKENKAAAVDDELRISKDSVFLFNPRRSAVADEDPNEEFYKKYAGKSTPIPVETYKKGLSEVYKKAQKHKISAGILGAETIKRSVKDNVREDMGDTIENITTFDPESATSSFYKTVRDYYLSCEQEFPDWKDKWKDYNRGGNFIYD